MPQVSFVHLVGWGISLLTIVVAAWINMRVNVARFETRLIEVEAKVIRMEMTETKILETLVRIETDQRTLLKEAQLSREKFDTYDENIRKFWETYDLKKR